MSKVAAIILTHGRPEVITVKTLRSCGFTGDIVLVLDDEDTTFNKYKENYPDLKIVTFSKREIANKFDRGDNFNDLRCVVYARNVAHTIAKKLGYTYFIELDDDYSSFEFTGNYEIGVKYKSIKNMDVVLNKMADFIDSNENIYAVAMAQGGDFIGGRDSNKLKNLSKKRKVMNSFVMRSDRPFYFFGTINEDTTTYVIEGIRGKLFFTSPYVSLTQGITQSNTSGLTDIYLHMGTYVKSFYSVMFAPSCVKISLIRDTLTRVHHKIIWKNCSPKIINDKFKKKDSYRIRKRTS